MNQGIQYFHYLGKEEEDRYYRVDWENKRVVQIVLTPGAGRRGNTHCVGIYFIALNSFQNSYHWKLGHKTSKFFITTKNQYEQAKQQILNKLS